MVVVDDVLDGEDVLEDPKEPEELPLTEPLAVPRVDVLVRSGVDVAVDCEVDGLMGPAVAADDVPVAGSGPVVVAVEPGVEIAVDPVDCFSVLLDGVDVVAELGRELAPDVAELCDVAV